MKAISKRDGAVAVRSCGDSRPAIVVISQTRSGEGAWALSVSASLFAIALGLLLALQPALARDSSGARPPGAAIAGPQNTKAAARIALRIIAVLTLG